MRWEYGNQGQKGNYDLLQNSDFQKGKNLSVPWGTESLFFVINVLKVENKFIKKAVKEFNRTCIICIFQDYS